MSSNLRIDHGNLKFNLTSPCANSVKEATMQFDRFFHQLFGDDSITASHNVDNVLDLHCHFIANATLDKPKDISYFVPACCVLQNDSTVNVDSLLGRYRLLRRQVS